MNRLMRFAAFVLAAATLIACCVTCAGAAEVTTGSFSVLNFNIAGLPSLSDSSGKESRQKYLGSAIKKDGFDIVCVEEDFGYDKSFAEGLDYPFRTYGFASCVFGDGLNIFSKSPVYDLQREKWDMTGGQLWEGDVVSQKGIMHTVARIADGVYVDVFVLHADAYGGASSVAARKDNFRQTAEFIKKHSNGFPAIVTGDFNCSFHFGSEGPDFRSVFIDELGFKDVWTELYNGGSFTDYSGWSGDYWGNWDSVEHILYRDGDGVTLTPVSHEYLRYRDGSGAEISDHAAESAVFTFTASKLADGSKLKAVPTGYSSDAIKAMSIIIRDLKYCLSHWDEVKALIKYRNDIEYLYANYSS